MSVDEMPVVYRGIVGHDPIMMNRGYLLRRASELELRRRLVEMKCIRDPFKPSVIHDRPWLEHSRR